MRRAGSLRLLLLAALLPATSWLARAERRAIHHHAAAAGEATVVAPPAPWVERARAAAEGRASAPRRGVRPANARLLPLAVLASAVAVAGAEQDVAGMWQQLDADADGSVSRTEYLAATLRLLDSQKVEDVMLRAKTLGYYRRLFDEGDINGDGHLSVAEVDYAEYLARTYGQTELVAFAAGDDLVETDFGAAERMTLMSAYDADSDGKVDMKEYVDAVKGTIVGLACGATDPEMTGWIGSAFHRADANSDGVLNGKEMHYAALIADELIREKRFAQDTLTSIFFQELDANGDGVIDQDEVAMGVAEVAKHRALTGGSIAENLRDYFEDTDKDDDEKLDEEEVSCLAARIIREAQTTA